MLEEAEGVFRDLASQMRAFAQNEILAVWIRYDPVMASAGLIGMSNSLATYGRCGRQHRGRCCGGGVGIRENTQLLTGRARMAIQIEQTGGPPCRRLKKEIRKKRNRRRTRTSLRPMCRHTRRHKARASRPSTRSRERPETVARSRADVARPVGPVAPFQAGRPMRERPANNDARRVIVVPTTRDRGPGHPGPHGRRGFFLF